MAALSGEDPRAPRGSIGLFGARHRARSAAQRRRARPALRPRGAPRPRRRADALAGAEHAADATARGRRGRLAAHRRDRARSPRALIGRFNVKAGGPDSAAKSLSGGNLQKFIVGREIDAQPKLLVVSQPTWGVDVGAAAQIRGELLALRDRGSAVLVVSEELDELFEICDRLLVIARRPRVAERAHCASDGRADRRVDERPLARAALPARRGEPCSSLRRAPSRRARCRSRRR